MVLPLPLQKKKEDEDKKIFTSTLNSIFWHVDGKKIFCLKSLMLNCVYNTFNPHILIKVIIIHLVCLFQLILFWYFPFFKKTLFPHLFIYVCISSWSVTIGGRPLFQIEVLAEVGRPVLIGCERMLSGGEGLFALKFNGFPLLLVLQPQEQSISGQGPMSRDMLPI